MEKDGNLKKQNEKKVFARDQMDTTKRCWMSYKPHRDSQVNREADFTALQRVQQQKLTPAVLNMRWGNDFVLRWKGGKRSFPALRLREAVQGHNADWFLGDSE